MADANIFQQYLRPVKSIQEFQAEADDRNLRRLELEGATRKNAMEAMAYGQAQQKQNALQRIAAGWTPQTTADERIASLRGNPYTFAEADALEKSTLDRRKTESEINAKAVETATKRLDTAGQAFGFVRDNPSLQSAQQAISYLVQNGVWDQKTAQGVAAQVQANPTPDAIRMLATQAYQSALSAKDQLPKLDKANLGGSMAFTAANPVTGAVSIMGQTPITQSADNAATNATARRGQDMSDRRQREALAAAVGKPFEVTGEDGKPVLVQQDKQGNIRPVEGYLPKTAAEKPLTEGQSKAVLFGARMQAANGIFDELAAKGVTTSVPGSRSGILGIGAMVNAGSNPMQQRLDQAKRDFINAVLRRESGAAISESEFDNAEKQYFPQVGDSEQVIQQKRSNRAIATRGMQAEIPKAQRGVLDEVIGKSASANSPAGAPKVVNFGDLK